LPEIVLVNELAAEVHLDELGVAALGGAVGDILQPPRNFSAHLRAMGCG